jgi:hypothetical protein
MDTPADNPLKFEAAPPVVRPPRPAGWGTRVLGAVLGAVIGGVSATFLTCFGAAFLAIYDSATVPPNDNSGPGNDGAYAAGEAAALLLLAAYVILLVVGVVGGAVTGGIISVRRRPKTSLRQSPPA